MTSVENDYVCILRGVGSRVSHVLQNVGNALRIVNVHLAAKGFDIVFHLVSDIL